MASWSPGMGHGVRVGGPPSVRRDIGRLAAQRSCFTEEGTNCTSSWLAELCLLLCQALWGILRSAGHSPCLQVQQGRRASPLAIPECRAVLERGSLARLGWCNGRKGCHRACSTLEAPQPRWA